MPWLVKVHVRLLGGKCGTGGQLEGSRSRLAMLSEGHRRLAGGFVVLGTPKALFDSGAASSADKVPISAGVSYWRECRPFSLGN